jgi:hypothetical protein
MRRFPLILVLLLLLAVAIAVTAAAQDNNQPSATTQADPRLAVAHLAPFAADPGTAVTITVDSTPPLTLTDVEYGDSTAYVSVPAGEYLVEIFPGGSTTAAISATVNLTDDTDYTAIATGDGANQPLELLALVDDNTPPASGYFRLRLGHLAPFASVLTDTLADVRLQDGTEVLTNVVFSDISTTYFELPAGTYDLKITTPGGATTLIDPLPVTLNDGDILSAFATGEGANQSLNVFALPSGQEGFMLPELRIFLPIIFNNTP